MNEFCCLSSFMKNQKESIQSSTEAFIVEGKKERDSVDF